MVTTAEIRDKIEQLAVDIGLARQFVQGADTATVALGGVQTPSVRKLVKDFKARENDVFTGAEAQAKKAADAATRAESAATTATAKLLEVRAEGTTQVGLVKTQGNTESTRVRAEGTTQVSAVRAKGDTEIVRLRNEVDTHIDVAEQAADRAEHAVQSIPGFVARATSIFGFTVNDGGCLICTQVADGETVNSADFATWDILPAETRFFVDNGNLVLSLPFQL